MKTLVVFSLFIVAILALPVLPVNNAPSVHTRAITCGGTPVDANYPTCSSVGSFCSASCDSCAMAFSLCSTTQNCTCFTEYVNCLAKLQNPNFPCSSQDAYTSCKTSLPSCGCGTPDTSTTFFDCNANGYCDSSSQRCVAKKGVGQSCKTAAECGIQNADPVYADEYDCVNSKCAKVTKYWPGDSCKSNDDCRFFSTYGLGCVNGICANQKVGKECPNYQLSKVCGSKLYCDEDDTCRNVIAVGGACNSTSELTDREVCGLDGVCSNGVCVAYLSKSVDQPCIYNDECELPLYCSQFKGGVCSKPLERPNCNTDQYCKQLNSDYKACECVGDATSPTCEIDYNTQCFTQAKNFYECASNHGCAGLFVPNFPGGCIQTNCAEEYSCLMDCSGAEAGFRFACLNGYVSTCPAPVSFGERNEVYWTMIASASVAAVLL